MKTASLSIFFCFISIAAFSQVDSVMKKIYSWIDKNHISLRKSFDGSSADEGKPASINWNNDYQNSLVFFTVDAGLKISEISLLNNSSSSLIVYPKAEFHRDDTKGKEKNNLGGGINLEFLPFPITSRCIVVPLVTGSSDYKYDFIKQDGTIVLKGFLSLKGNKNFLPGANTRDGKSRLILRYYPYTGIEYYTKQSGDTVKSASMWANRLFVELWPIPSYAKQYFQVIFDYTYRKNLEDGLYNGSDFSILTISANIYPDGNGKFGFGVDYTVGDDPTNNFTRVEKIGFGVKFKL